MLNKNWTRWIRASIYKHFNTYRENLILFFEPQERISREYVEVRANGPIYIQLNRKEYDVLIDVSTIITTIVSKDMYNIFKRQGIVESIMGKPINVLKYGDGDGSLGCLKLNGRLVSNYFGKIAHDVTLEQATVEGQYQMTLEG